MQGLGGIIKTFIDSKKNPPKQFFSSIAAHKQIGKALHDARAQEWTQAQTQGQLLYQLKLPGRSSCQ